MATYIGYHGTDNEAAEKICAAQYFKPSRKEDEWLGEGTYFFFNYDDADWWCWDCRKLKDYTILQADINAEPDNIINLSYDYKYLKMFKSFCNIVKDKSQKKVDGTSRSNYMSLALKGMMKSLHIDVVIAAFDQNRQFWLEGVTRKYKDEFLTKFPIVVGQLQICVINSKCISNIKNHFPKRINYE